MVDLDSQRRKKVAVIGGGISGLAAAFTLQQSRLDFDIYLFEASHRLGGVIETSREPQYVIEHGADNFATLIPHARELSHEIGIDDQMIHPNREHRFAKIVRNGQVVSIPDGFSLMQPTRIASILTTSTLSMAGKLRLLTEPWIKRRTEVDDESLESFVVRRLGRETYDRLVEPIIGGIFTADGSTLSMQAALPQFVAMEREHGSLMRAFWASQRQSSSESKSASKASGARYDQFVSHREGMGAWIESIQAKLTNVTIRTGIRVHKILPTSSQGSWDGSFKNHALPEMIESSSLNASRIASSNSWTLHVSPSDAKSASEVIEFDRVIVACPAAPAALMLGDLNPKIPQLIRAIPYADSAVVTMIVDRDDVDPKLFCFGIVVPKVEGLDALAISFTSEKYPGRVPKDKLLLRVFLGGAARSDILLKSDSQLFDLAWNDTVRLLKIKNLPAWSRVIRWPAAMPQYLVGHTARMRELEKALEEYPTLALAGNAYSGVGIPQCVRSGQQAAKRIIESLEQF